MDQRNLNQYELQQLLASDHLSEFWKAFDTQQRRFVHIKILHIPQAALGDFAPKFFQETQKLSSLQHPNIASIVDTQIVTGAQANKAFVVTEYLDGQLLSDFLRETVHSGAFLAPNEVVKLLMALGSAIDYAHQQVIIHGAIQPGNILLTKRDADRNSVGEIKLLGFGGQHLIPPHALPLEATEYIAPERAQGLHENLRGDIYSMGVLLYELSTGTLPFEGASPAETLALQIQVVPTSPALINPQIRPALTAVIMRSLAKEPVNRFPNAMTFVGAVARALQVSNDFPSLVNQTPNFTPSSFSGPISTSGLNNSSTHFAPYPPQSSGVYSALPTVGNYSPVQNPPARNTGGIPPVYSQKSSESGAFAKQYSQPYSQPANPAFQPAKSGRQPGRLYLILTSLLILALLVSAFGFFFVNNRDKFFGTAAAPLPSLPIIGQAFFVSSG